LQRCTGRRVQTIGYQRVLLLRAAYMGMHVACVGGYDNTRLMGVRVVCWAVDGERGGCVHE